MVVASIKFLYQPHPTSPALHSLSLSPAAIRRWNETQGGAKAGDSGRLNWPASTFHVPGWGCSVLRSTLVGEMVSGRQDEIAAMLVSAVSAVGHIRVVAPAEYQYRG